MPKNNSLVSMRKLALLTHYTVREISNMVKKGIITPAAEDPECGTLLFDPNCIAPKPKAMGIKRCSDCHYWDSSRWCTLLGRTVAYNRQICPEYEDKPKGYAMDLI